MVNVAKLVRKKMGEILVDEGLLKEEQVEDALRLQKERGGLLGEILVGLGALSEMDIARAICKQFGLPYVDASRYAIDKEIQKLLPPKLMIQHRFVALDKIGKTLVIAVAGVLDAATFEDLERKTGSDLTVYVSTNGQVVSALKKHYPDSFERGNGAA
jgi:hypothetical protein